METNKETTMTTFKASGKAIGGGKLTRVFRGTAVVGTINETLGLFIASGLFEANVNGWQHVCHSMDEAKALFCAEVK